MCFTYLYCSEAEGIRRCHSCSDIVNRLALKPDGAVGRLLLAILSDSQQFQHLHQTFSPNRFRATQFEEALRRFRESLSIRQGKSNSPFVSTTSPSSSPSTSASSHPTGVEISSGRGYPFNDLSSYIPSLQPLLSNIADLRKELAVSITRFYFCLFFPYFH